MKKKISLILVISMLLSIFLPGLRAFANEDPTGKNVADKITVNNLVLNSDNGSTIDPNRSQGLSSSFDFVVKDNSVKAGDYFEIKLSKNMNFFGDSTASPVPNFKNSAGALIATGEYDEEEHKLIYTFTDYVENSRNVKGHGEFTFWVDRYKVTDNGDQTFKVNVSDQEASTMLNVNFTNSKGAVDSFITESNPFGTNFTQVVYVNPHHNLLNNTVLRIQADLNNQQTNSIAQINDKSSFEIYEVPLGTKFPSSFGVDTNSYGDPINIVPTIGSKNGVDYAEFDFKNKTSKGTGYIVIMHSDTSGREGGLRVSAKVTSTSLQDYHFRDNENIITSANTDIEAENVYQLGDFVWEDSNKNGIQDEGEKGVEGVKVTLTKPDGTIEEKTTDENGYYIFDNLPNGTYTVKFETPEGYKSTEPNKGDERFDSNGVESTVTINGSNDYTIDYGIVKVEGEKGTFVEEHHYFIEYRDAKGNPVNAQGELVEEGQNIIEQTDLEVIEESTEGTKDEKFSSRLINIEDYKYNSEKTDTNFQEGTTIDENGDVSGNYVAGEEQKVVYNYYKTVNPKAETGSVYVKYVTEDGTVLEAESAVKENSPAGEEYTTEKKTFDGYEFSKMADDSADANGNVVGGKKLHVTYVYKPVENPTPKTGNVYVKYVTEDGKVLEAESVVKKDAPAGEEYTTEKKTFDGYEFVGMHKDSSPTNGTVKEEDQHVIYVYNKIVKPEEDKGNVDVRYITEDGVVLEGPTYVKENAPDGEDYTTEQKSFENYEFVKMADDSAKAEGKVVAGETQHVIYVYRSTQPETGNVYVKYVTEDGEILESESIVKKDAPDGEKYTTEEKTFKGYEFVKMADDSAKANGKVVAGEDLHVTYVYKEVNSSDNTSGGSSSSGGSSRPDRPSRPHRPSGDNSVIIHYEPSNNNTNTNVTKPEVNNTTPQDNAKPSVTDDDSKTNVTEDKTSEVTTNDTANDESRDRDDESEAVGSVGPHDYSGPTGGSDDVKHLPKTGDGLNTSTYVGILLVAGAAITALGFRARKKENEE